VSCGDNKYSDIVLCRVRAYMRFIKWSELAFYFILLQVCECLHCWIIIQIAMDRYPELLVAYGDNSHK
jgi:hypothetical protein